ncbi:MAG: OmpA family protein [Desulfovibrionaceae bacterium]
MKHVIFAAAAVLGAALFVGCGNLHSRVVNQSTWHMDAPVQRSNLMIYVKPQSRHNRPLSALFFPLRVTQDTQDTNFLGRQCGKLMWQVWTSKEVFRTLAYDEDLFMRSPRYAAAEARRRGADLAVIGSVPYLLAGGTAGDSAVSIQLKILDARSGETLISLDESARLENVLQDDYIFWVRKTRLPDSPIYVAVSTIAEDMALPVKAWSGGAYANQQPGRQAADEDRRQVSALTQPVAPSSFEPAPLQEGLFSYAPQQLQQAHDAASMERQLVGKEDGQRNVLRLKVEFDYDKASIRQSSYPDLDKLGHALTGPELAGREIVITGHTDSDGAADYNKKLSMQRAEAVRKYLADHFSIAPDLIQVEAYGENKPLAPNSTAENKQTNRRVEIQLAEQ